MPQPYYFDLAPNYDDTLTLRHITERGQMLENEFRYLNRHGRYELGFGYMDKDQRRNNEARWIVGFDHSGSPAQNWNSSIDYTAVSDGDYFDDLGTNLNLSKQSHLDQLARLGYRSRHTNFQAQVRDYQTIDDADRPYRKLPSLSLNGSPEWDYDGLLVDYLADYTYFDRDPADFIGSERTTGGRLHLQSTLMAPFEQLWGYLRPAVSVTHTQYDLNNQPGSNSTPSRTLPIFSLDTGLYFDRFFEFDRREYTQTLEPRLFVLEVPFKNQDDLPNFDSSELTFAL